ncbi:aminotransferase-like domain-containing protein [Paenibacillus sp. IHBB 10380]|uniref:aminotransferase-like domain-containing protein n=1 Tax=Paenibacillus sp. IHBB 10380 TaxID=1566358 RepID=UPI0005CFCE60|nr:PLP-dependent aminotransferase family protein [Paenibacillus sp. IHBB 10380]AJS58642.1 GntR family transcriptional regulator [Paenibacillus sp. IHBB 10380]
MPVNSFEHYPMTWKPDKKQLVSPLYRSIASLLEYDILNGYLPPNTKLPPQRELADYLDINLSTITRAFKICEVKGLIYAVIGRGTFVTPNARNAIFMAESSEGQNYIEMGIVKPLDCSNGLVAEAIKSIANNNYLEQLLDYRHPLGMPYHRMAARKWMQRFSMDAPVENIAITSGGQNALTLILISLFHPGDKIAVDTYTYPNFIELANILNIQLIPIEGDQLGMMPERLDAACRTNQLQGIYIVPSCNNPTAVTMDMNRRKDIAEIIKKHELILIEDDIYSFLAPEGYLPVSHFVPERFVYILSIAKSLSSGMRVAFIAYANSFVEKITYGIFNINIKTSALNAEVITELINTGVADRIIRDKKEMAKVRNELYQKYFQITNPHENPLSFFRWLPLSQLYQLKQFEQNALAHGIHVYHSDRFLAKKDESAQFIRISLTSAKDVDELDRGLCLLKRLLLDTE